MLINLEMTVMTEKFKFQLGLVSIHAGFSL